MLMHQDLSRGVHLNQKHEIADNNTILNGMK